MRIGLTNLVLHDTPDTPPSLLPSGSGWRHEFRQVLTLLVLPVLGVELGAGEALETRPRLALAVHLATSLIWIGFTVEFLWMISATLQKLALLPAALNQSGEHPPPLVWHHSSQPRIGLCFAPLRIVSPCAELPQATRHRGMRTERIDPTTNSVSHAQTLGCCRRNLGPPHALEFVHGLKLRHERTVARD